MDTTTANEKAAKTRLLEEKYEELMRMVQLPAPPCRENLEQPSPLKIVESVTTYSAYEDPI